MINRHVHPKARPETPEPPPPTPSGIAYLDIIAGTHRQQVAGDELIGFHAIYSEDLPASADQIPGQLSLDDLNDEHHTTPAGQVAR